MLPYYPIQNGIPIKHANEYIFMVSKLGRVGYEKIKQNSWYKFIGW